MLIKTTKMRNKLARMWRKKRKPGACWVGMKIGVAAVMERIWKCLKKLEIEWPHHPAIPFGYLSKGNEDTNLKRHIHAFVHCSTISVIKVWKQRKYQCVNG